MAIHGTQKDMLETFVPDRERVCKQVGAAEEATLETVEERSIDSFGASINGQRQNFEI